VRQTSHSKRNTLYQLAASNPYVHWAATTNNEAQTLPDCLSKKKKLNYYQGHSRSNDKNKNKKTLTTQSFEINVAKDPTASD
jgi:hypothetical protein